MAANFEKSITDLEKVVDTLEKGDMPLDEMLVLFEKGIKLSRECAKILDASEKKVTMLVKGESAPPSDSTSTPSDDDLQQITFDIKE